MDNNSISQVLADVAVLMQAKGENVFKVRAHSKASDQIKSLSYPITDIAEDADKLGEIPGFGAGIIEIVQELTRTGRLGLFEELSEELPDGVLELVQIPGIGPKIAVTAANDLGISTYEQLAASIESGDFQSLPRISKKGAVQILRHVNARVEQGKRIGIGPATQAASDVIAELKERCPQIAKIEVAGSVRRSAELIGNINIVCAVSDASDSPAITDAFTTLSNVHEVQSHDDRAAVFTDSKGFSFLITVVGENAFAGALVYATGSVAHGKQLEKLAIEHGSELTSFGLIDAGDGSVVDVQSEEDLYSRLGLDFVPPEMRENSGELEIAAKHELPKMVTLDDIRGDLHSHTNWSDGRYPMEDMVAAAANGRGFEYLAVTDHSPSATVANGLKPDMLLAHNTAVRELSESSPIRLLTGTEMDIKPDGSLDYSDELLADLDIVIASIHSGMDQDSATMTQRVIDAMASPHVDVICHLTARLLGKRAPVEMDVEAVLEAAVRTGTVMEINASPDRVDLRADHVRRAVDLGVIFAINTDSHRTWQFDNMRFGVNTAIRGGVEPKRVINTLHYAELMAFLALPKSERYAFNESRG
ncbi:MAG: DNA polymerase/3'-5' exonuclease PolX [Chloroflexi bacterium]|jgi:DNA polymerase (family X)|nr:DNA polymerase/3'-5' exonuclease PolX [Chloroflexota bacterium]MBT5628502.1 DNA polymerase/3'-5' exonuclease PolX [Chloroflexota bacterium]